MHRGSAARVAAAEDRGPAGEELDGRGHGGRPRLRGLGGGGGDGHGGREGPLEGLPVHGGAPHRARAVRREATPVGREGATTSNR